MHIQAHLHVDQHDGAANKGPGQSLRHKHHCQHMCEDTIVSRLHTHLGTEHTDGSRPAPATRENKLQSGET